MTAQDSLFDQPTPVEDVVEEVESQRSTFSLAKREFLLGLFATWVAKEQGRQAASVADRKQAAKAADAALSALQAGTG